MMRAEIVHNEVANVSYDGIDTGYGWGTNDAGGSDDYADRGYYNWSPRYDTPTTLKDNHVAGNLVHDTKARFADGGTLYNLSRAREPSSSGTTSTTSRVSRCTSTRARGTRRTGTTCCRAGTRGFSPTRTACATTRTKPARGQLVQLRWGADPERGCEEQPVDRERAGHRRRLAGGGPGGHVRGGRRAGVPHGAQRQPVRPGGLPEGVAADARLSTTGALAASTLFAQSGSDFGIAAAGADIWGGGGQRDDEFGSIYRAGAVDSDGSVVARVNSVNDVNAWAKSGVMIRNEIADAGSSGGYAVTAVTRRNGIVFEWDSNGDGYLDRRRERMSTPSVRSG